MHNTLNYHMIKPRTVGGAYPDRASRPHASHHSHGSLPSFASSEIPDPTLMFPTLACPIPTRLKDPVPLAPAVHLAGLCLAGYAGLHLSASALFASDVCTPSFFARSGFIFKRRGRTRGCQARQQVFPAHLLAHVSDPIHARPGELVSWRSRRLIPQIEMAEGRGSGARLGLRLLPGREKNFGAQIALFDDRSAAVPQLAGNRANRSLLPHPCAHHFAEFLRRKGLAQPVCS